MINHIISLANFLTSKLQQFFGSVRSGAPVTWWGVSQRHAMKLSLAISRQSHLAMDQYLYIPFLGGWTAIYQLFWGSLGTRVLTHPHIPKKNGKNRGRCFDPCFGSKSWSQASLAVDQGATKDGLNGGYNWFLLPIKCWEAASLSKYTKDCLHSTVVVPQKKG
jgi:hypothetical protein